jgi:hypothetical protein
MGRTEVDKSHTLRLRPNFRVGTYVGRKQELLSKQEQGSNLKDCCLEKNLLLVGESEVHFTAVA